MIARAQYSCTGSEKLIGGKTIIPAAVSSGLTVTHLFVDGAGRTAFGDDVNMLTGEISITGSFPRGSIIQWLYKTLPKFSSSVSTITDFDIADFESADFE
jgi:hypothetical protein